MASKPAVVLFAPSLAAVIATILATMLATMAACSSQSASVLSPLGSSSSTTTATTTATDTGTSKTVFSDAFDQGYEANWTWTSGDGPATDTKDGSNAIVSLDATSNDFSRLHCNSGGDKFTAQNVTASMRVRIEAQPSSSSRLARLDVRQPSGSENIFYAVGAVVSPDDGSVTKVGLYKKVAVVPDSGNYTLCQLARTSLSPAIAMGTWLSLAIKVQDAGNGVHLDSYVNGQPIVSYDDDCQKQLEATNGQTVNNGGCLNGNTGLGIQIEGGIEASVDDVLVVAQ